MAATSERGPVTVRSMLPILGASTIGTAIEWYDFFLYGFLAATVFPKLFFPELDPVAGTIAAFTTNFVGFLARPLGGAFFGWFGDRVGRKSTLIATLLLMGIATTLMGLLPGYAQIGLAAPLLLSILRFLQGAGVGGLLHHWVAYSFLVKCRIDCRWSLHPFAHPGDSCLQAGETGGKGLPYPGAGGVPPLLARDYPVCPVAFG